MRYIEGENPALNTIGLLEEANSQLSQFIDELIDRGMFGEAESIHNIRCTILAQALEVRHIWHMMYDHDHDNV